MKDRKKIPILYLDTKKTMKTREEKINWVGYKWIAYHNSQQYEHILKVDIQCQTVRSMGNVRVAYHSHAVIDAYDMI